MKPYTLSSIIISLLLLSFCSVMGQEKGKASYYADRLHGNKTSSGEPYDKNKYTAAHRTLSFGAIVKVTNLKNGKAVIVRINDMGPHNLSRVIDLSRAAAEAIDMIRDGTVEVRLDVISEFPEGAKYQLGPTTGGGVPPKSSTPATSANQRTRNTPPQTGQASSEVFIDMTNSQPAPSTNISLPNILPGQSTGPTAKPVGNQAAPPPVTAGATARTIGPDQTGRSLEVTASAKGMGLYKFSSYRVVGDGYGIQIGAFSDYRNVLETSDKLMQQNIQDLMIHTKVVDGKDVFRMIIGPFPSRGAAEAFKGKLAAINMKGIIIGLKELN